MHYWYASLIETSTRRFIIYVGLQLEEITRYLKKDINILLLFLGKL